MKPVKEITQQHNRLVAALYEELGPWRKFLIGIDGRDDTGKSTLARFLAWQMDIPAIETDQFTISNEQVSPIYRYDELRPLFEARFKLNRPVIVEGVFLLKTVRELGFEIDYQIYTLKEGREGSVRWQDSFVEYEAVYNPMEKADFVFTW